MAVITPTILPSSVAVHDATTVVALTGATTSFTVLPAVVETAVEVHPGSNSVVIDS